ncbi:MAG: type-F conjugative transfer system secretin TraK [Gammaproteobacteria bacterium]
MIHPAWWRVFAVLILAQVAGLARGSEPAQASDGPADPAPDVATATIGGLAMPIVPVAALGAASRTADADPADLPAAPLPPLDLTVLPGVNEIIPVAQGHLNRLVTPFDTPRVRTVSSATTQVEGNVVYIASADLAPITLYITPGDTEALALSLTLAPRRIPPREIRLQVEPQAMARALATVPAPVSHPAGAEPHVERLKALLRALALGEIPRGFALRTPRADESLTCAGAGATPDLRQVIEGSALTLYVAVLENPGLARWTVNEADCAVTGAAIQAAATWPTAVLGPGDAAELYVAAVPTAPDRAGRARPALLSPAPGGSP